jgi:hypothetical protein
MILRSGICFSAYRSSLAVAHRGSPAPGNTGVRVIIALEKL